MNDPEFDKIIDAQIDKLKKLKSHNLNSLEESNNEDQADAIQELSDNSDPDVTGFFVEDDVNFHVKEESEIRLILDSGASKSTFSDIRLLSNLKPVDKKMKTYSGSVDITHIGSMRFGKYTIFPVYLAPSGKCNLISVSQLEDHGIKIHHKNKLFLVLMGSSIIESFPRIGDLYVSSGSSVFSTNSLFSLSEKTEKKDWHIILGHPSDLYVSKFLDLMGIPKNNHTGSSSDCEVCRMAKITRKSHLNSLPSADSPFKMIHADVLQISPLSKNSFQYILVLIDDFSRFNRIYLLQKKNESKTKIMSFINEVHNFNGTTPAIIHTDRGGEFARIHLNYFYPVVEFLWRKVQLTLLKQMV